MSAKVITLQPINKQSDEELVTNFAATRESKYFGELYRRYAHLSFGVGLKYLKEEAAANDIVAEVFEILYKKIPTANIQSFKKYLYTVTRNECIGKLRQSKYQTEKLEDYKIFEKNSVNFMENDALIRHLDKEPEIEAIIAEAMEKLNEGQKHCIRLFFFENKSYKDIVEMTDYTEKQVKSFLQNGKRNLKNLLQDEIEKRKN